MLTEVGEQEIPLFTAVKYACLFIALATYRVGLQKRDFTFRARLLSLK